MFSHKKIYKTVLELLEGGSVSRNLLISRATKRLMGPYGSSVTPIGERTELTGRIGSVLEEMLELGVITVSEEGDYKASASKPVALRVEMCEREILALLRDKPRTKMEIRNALERKFGTDRTPSQRDDNILYSFVGQILKRLINYGIIKQSGGKYEIAPEKSAKLDDIDQMLSLKGSFLSRLHSRGGEYFEHYFMTLLGKYLSKQGKTVTENYTTGGSADGGIDGIIKTVDPLGFKENIMVQTKNRNEPTAETAVRGFYGAVCAEGGSRGIFATSSSFHPEARALLERIDNCVGVDGDRLFQMAKECLYGIKRRDGKYVVDTKII